MLDVEINKKSDLFSTQSQIREQLCFVDWQDYLDRLQFDEDQAFYNQIRTILYIHNLSVVSNCDWDLRFYSYAPLPQLANKTGFISTLKQTDQAQSVPSSRHQRRFR